MNQPLRLSSAASLIALGSMIAGCAAQHAHLGATAQVAGRPAELGYATRALVALNSNNVPMAVDFAEKAVARSPGDAPVRTLLGNAYFAAGRFISAEAAFRDSLTIDSNQPAVILKLALVEIAQGKDNRAVAMLKDARGLLQSSDYGLALALAGRSEEAISVLEPAARQQGADATVRQNLALAYALAGNWDEAKIVAGQDVPANQLDQRIAQWMQLAKPAHAADQVAAVVGVTPASIDPGQPLQLALNSGGAREQKFERRPVQLAAAPVATASVVPSAAQKDGSAKPAFAASTAAFSAPIAIPAAAPAASLTHTTSIATLAASAVSEARTVLASLVAHRQPAPLHVAKVRVAARRPVSGSEQSHAVVQLGAYASADRVLAAWTGDSHRYGLLKAYAPMSARFASPKGTFYRLSVRGFQSVAEAKALCSSLRHEGGACFVRNVAGDAPVNIALR